MQSLESGSIRRNRGRLWLGGTQADTGQLEDC